VEIPRHFKLYQAACKNEVGSSGLLHVLVAVVVLGLYREQSEREGKKVGKKKTQKRTRRRRGRRRGKNRPRGSSKRRTRRKKKRKCL
jgi:hypothetical protein